MSHYIDFAKLFLFFQISNINRSHKDCKIRFISKNKNKLVIIITDEKIDFLTSPKCKLLK